MSSGFVLDRFLSEGIAMASAGSEIGSGLFLFCFVFLLDHVTLSF